MMTVFIYHCTRFFDPEGWHLKNTFQSELLFVLMRGLIWNWVMELFLLLSGIGTWYALSPRRTRTYTRERVKRLLIPLYTAGLFVLLPLQFYFEVSTNRGYNGDFLQVIPRYFPSFTPPRITQWPSTLLPIPFFGHLWFLGYLNTNHKFLIYGNEAVLPFYLFHQTFILSVGFYVIRWDRGILLKLLIISVVSFPAIMILYELLVRRYNPVRFFFGMRQKKRHSATPTQLPAL